MSNAGISMASLVGMSLRQVNIKLIVNSRIMLVQAGIEGVHTSELETHFLAGGDLRRTVRAVVAANRSRMDLDFDRASAIDLAGRDVLEAVQTSVVPRVILCPNPGSALHPSVSAVSRDGVELKIQARVTVRTNLELLIGGATESTVIARVGQGIVTAVGSAQTHTDVLSEPDAISKRLIYQGLDSHTAYAIVSIDIARIDVGENIAARIRTDQAQADMRVAQAVSEGRRAEALARTQEMCALVKCRKAELVLADALVPIALGNAIQHGNIGESDKFYWEYFASSSGLS